MAKHTAGPWDRPKKTLDKKAWFIGYGNWDIATVEIRHATNAVEAEANAALIAAAPELLEACKLAASVVLQNRLGRQFPELRNMLSAAIAKATP